MKCDICLFCGNKMKFKNSFFYHVTFCNLDSHMCYRCNSEFIFSRKLDNNDPDAWDIYYTTIHTNINDIIFSVAIFDNRTVIRNSRSTEEILIDRKLSLTPSNIKDKLKLYLTII